MERQGRSAYQQPRSTPRGIVPPIQTQNHAPSNRFSYTQTPAQHHVETFPERERPQTIIDESPMIEHDPYHQGPLSGQGDQAEHLAQAHGQDQTQLPRETVPAQQAPDSPYPEDKKVPPSRQGTPHEGPLPNEIHPAYYAPYAESAPQIQQQQQQQHHAQLKSIPPLQYQRRLVQSQVQQQATHQTQYQTKALPQPPYRPDPHQQHPNSSVPTSVPLNILSSPTFADPRTPPSTYHSHFSPSSQFSPSGPSNLEHKPSPPPPVPQTPAYTPASTFGPNGTHASAFPPPRAPEQPGPTSPTPGSWRTSLFAPSATCGLSLFCPCIVYGRAQYRLSQRHAKPPKPATDLLGYKAVNTDCMVFGLACGLQGLLAAVQRYRVRREYGIEGGLVGDCLTGCCCCCCAVAQGEGEIRAREEERERAGRAGRGAGGYVAMGGMEFAPPPRGR